MGCVFPPMFNMSDDFNTQMMYAQMMNGGGANGGTSANLNTGGNSGSNSQGTSGKKFSWGDTALWGLGTAGATYVGMNWLNHDFNSPVQKVGGKIQFTDDFMRSFSGEYAAMKNGDTIKNFYSKLSTAADGKFKFTVNAENYDGLMDELKTFLAEDPASRNFADMSDDLKGFLKSRIGKDVVPSGVTVDDSNRWMYELVDADNSKINEIYSKTTAEAAEINFKNNYNLQRELYESFDDLAKGFTECADDAARLEYLKNNPNFAHTLANNTDDLARVLAGDVSVLSSLKSADAAKTGLKTSMDTVESAMQSFAKKWNGKAGFFGKGNFKVFNKKTAGVLDDALASMRRGKGGRYALIAGLAVAGASVLFNA